MHRLLCFYALVSCAWSACNPPTTDLVANQCGSNSVVTIDADSVASVPYPPNPNAPFRFQWLYNNAGLTTYDNLLVDVGIEYYGQLLWTCGWHTIYLPLNNLPATELGSFKPGTNTTTLSIDMSQYESIATVINGIGGNKYYRLTMNIKDSNKQPVVCLKIAFLLA